MPTFTALTTMDGQETAEALAAAVENVDPEPTGVGVFEVEDGSGLWEVGAYFTESPDEIALAILAKMYDVKPFVVSEIPDQDWVAKVQRELPPVPAGRFFVFGSHDADKVPDDKIPLRIEAAMAFGTGHHGTTLGCLKAVDRLIEDGFEAKRTVDVGCGTAVLAMAAAKVWPAPVYASDIDPVAVDVARANVTANALEGRIVCEVAAGFDAPVLRDAAPFDLVFANILKGPLMALARDMAAVTKEGGFAILSGILNEQADEVEAHYTALGYQSYHRESIVDWTTLTLRKKGSLT
ncbi:MAG: 50S ribosomal protein L11 methyltransferase [Loktanella sp.]|nr:50S ribosomal protein L11 methyltransferase [Loktanella sp.]